MDDVTFPTDGSIISWEYYAVKTSPHYSWITTWTRNSNETHAVYILTSKTKLEASSLGVTLYSPQEQPRVKAGDVMALVHVTGEERRSNQGQCVSYRRLQGQQPCRRTVIRFSGLSIDQFSIGDTFAAPPIDVICRQFSLRAVFRSNRGMIADTATFTGARLTQPIIDSHPVLDSASGYTAITCAAWCSRTVLCASFLFHETERFCQLISAMISPGGEHSKHSGNSIHYTSENKQP
ncbi:uncharacterized protein LOC141912302 [Tubulanus polymorphus]|uniref:uncharacterized protein LOC141912302 n=1 Tax=Tubulanus polymorphus TaxID=672921 RepID=UPI003DA4AEEF